MIIVRTVFVTGLSVGIPVNLKKPQYLNNADKSWEARPSRGDLLMLLGAERHMNGQLYTFVAR